MLVAGGVGGVPADRGRGGRCWAARPSVAASSRIRIRLFALPFDSVFTTRTRPTSAVDRTCVPPSACLSIPTMSITRIGSTDVGDQRHLRADQVRVGERLGPREEAHEHGHVLGEARVELLLDLATDLLAHALELEVHPRGAGVVHVAAGDLGAVLGEDHAGERVQRRVGPHHHVAPIPVDLGASPRCPAPAAARTRLDGVEHRAVLARLRGVDARGPRRPAQRRIPVSPGWPPPRA